MTKDFKIGMLSGLILVSITGLWFSLSKTASVKSRLLHLQNTKTTLKAKTQISSDIQDKTDDSTTQKEQNAAGIQYSTENKITKNTKLNEEIKTTQFHTVRKGETLSELSVKYYGSANRWTEIRDANPKIDIQKLQPGTTLIIPP